MQRKQPSRRLGRTGRTSHPSRTERSEITVRRWPQFVILGLSLVACAGLYSIGVGSALPAGPTELHTVAQSHSAGNLLANPLLLPYKLLATLLVMLPGSDVVQIRLTAALIGLATVVLFYLVARRWYGFSIALWSAWLFALSGWLLQSSRIGIPVNAISLTIIALIAASAWLRHADHINHAVIGFGLALALSLLTPGGIWFAIAATAIVYPYLLKLRENAKPASVAIAASLVGIAAVLVVIAALRSPQLLFQWLGLPHVFPDITTIGKQAAGSLSYLVARGPNWPELWLAHTPILDVASTVFMVLGTMFYLRHLDNARSRLLVTFAGLGAILIALNGAPALALIIPVAYLVIGSGAAYYMHQWHKVFPRNPLARGVGLGLMVVLLACIITFHIERSFVAWRHSPDTQATYNQHQAEAKPPNLLQ